MSLPPEKGARRILRPLSGRETYVQMIGGLRFAPAPATFLKPSKLKKVLQLLRSKLAIDLIKRTLHTSSAAVKYVGVDHSCTYIFMS